MYEDLPTAPMWLEKGNWQAVSDMAESVASYIKKVKAERMAEIQEAGEAFPAWGYALAAIAIISAISHAIASALG